MPEDLLGALSAIVGDAGQIAAQRANEDFRRWEKSPGQPVCEVDLELDAFLRRELTALDPAAGWLSEETIDDSDRGKRQRVWVVDPIDGTRDYVRGRAGWCVSAALIEDNAVVAGVLAAPLRGDHWTAAAGMGAWRNGEPVRVAARQSLAGARVPADSLSKPDRDLVMVEKPNSIALRIAKVAAGEADLVATLRWGHEWDIAAAALIAAEAGAIVTDAFGQALRFNTHKAEAFGVIIATPGIHAEAVARLAERAGPASIR